MSADDEFLAKYRERQAGRARGVNVVPEWMTFTGFLASMGERPKGTTLSRFGDTSNYEPGNCAWHMPAQQHADARKKRLMKVNSGSMPTLAERQVYVA